MSTEHAGAIVFTDIVGFTELTELHGDDAAMELVDAQDRIVRGALPAGARVIKELGDGLLLWFDDAADAIRTSIVLQRRFDEHRTDPLPLWVRMGVHWGTPRRRGDDIIGRDVNLASRIAGVAGAGEVLCSEAAVRAAGPVTGTTFAALGSVFVKGVADPVPLYRALPSTGRTASAG